MEKENCINLLKSIPFFTGTQESHLSYFIENSSQKEYKKGNNIFFYGDSVKHFFIVIEGWVKLYRMNKQGEETLISLVTKGETFSEVATFKGSSYPYNAQIVGGDAKFLVINANIIRQRITQYPELALKMLASMSHYTNQLSLMFEHITKLTSAQRLGSFLLKLSMDRGYSKTLQLPYRKYLVASRLSMQPETYSRAMLRLKSDLDMIFEGREVIIKDLDQLQDYCEVECFDDKKCDIEKRLQCTNPQCDMYHILKFM
jgi:CRP-like cAMP-binding protein